MNKTEFKTWFDDFAVRFPDRFHWLEKGRDDSDWERVQKSWRQTLDDVSLEDCTVALVSLQKGDIDAPKSIDDFPGVVRKHARQLGRDRRAIRELKKTREPIERMTGQPVALGGIFRELLKMHEAGATEDEQVAMLQRRFPPVPPERQHRYGCAFCLDTGFMTIWSFAAVKAAIEGRSLPAARTEVARCYRCERGRPRGRMRKDVDVGYKGPIEETPAFDAKQMLNVLGGDTHSEAAIARLHEWLQSQKDQGVNSQRHGVFDAFNRGEDF